LSNAEQQQSLDLFALDAAQLVNGDGRQRDRSRPASLGLFEPYLFPDLFEALHDANDAVIEIDAFPAQRQDLAAPRPCVQRQQYGRVDVRMANRVEQGYGLLGRQGRHVGQLDPGQPPAALEDRGISGDELVLDRTSKGAE
jgi:hypothetical protein